MIECWFIGEDESDLRRQPFLYPTLDQAQEALKKLQAEDLAEGCCGYPEGRIFHVTARLAEPILCFDGLHLDPVRLCVSVDANEVELTALEFQTLRLFAQHPGVVLDRPTIMSYIWKNAVSIDSVDVFVHRLRKKLDPVRPSRFILTHRNIGYSFRSVPEFQRAETPVRRETENTPRKETQE